MEQETLQQRRLEDRDAASSNAGTHRMRECIVSSSTAQRPPQIPTRFPHQTWLGWDWESPAPFFSGPLVSSGRWFHLESGQRNGSKEWYT